MAAGDQEGEDGFFQLFEALAGGIDDFAVVDVDAFAALVAFFSGHAAETLPEAGKFLGRRRIVAIDGKGTAADDQRPEHWAVTCLINPCEDHGGDYIEGGAKCRVRRGFAPARWLRSVKKKCVGRRQKWRFWSAGGDCGGFDSFLVGLICRGSCLLFVVGCLLCFFNG